MRNQLPGPSRKSKRGSETARRTVGERSDGRRAARATLLALLPRPGTLGLILAAAAMVAGGVYALNGFGGKSERRSSVASLPQPPAPPAQTRALASPPAATASDEAAKSRKPTRREASALAQDDPAMDRWFMEAYLRCWSPPTKTPADGDYAAKIRVQHNADGSLAGAPVLVNPPSDPDWRAYAESAVRAVKKCNPLSVPTEYAPRYDRWRRLTLYFSPDSAHE